MSHAPPPSPPKPPCRAGLLVRARTSRPAGAPGRPGLRGAAPCPHGGRAGAAAPTPTACLVPACLPVPHPATQWKGWQQHRVRALALAGGTFGATRVHCHTAAPRCMHARAAHARVRMSRLPRRAARATASGGPHRHAARGQGRPSQPRLRACTAAAAAHQRRNGQPQQAHLMIGTAWMGCPASERVCGSRRAGTCLCCGREAFKPLHAAAPQPAAGGSLGRATRIPTHQQPECRKAAATWGWQCTSRANGGRPADLKPTALRQPAAAASGAREGCARRAAAAAAAPDRRRGGWMGAGGGRAGRAPASSL